MPQQNKMTIFNTPILLPLFSMLGKIIITLTQWRIHGELPKQPCIIIAAPHTSNWDFPLVMAAIFSQRWQINWIGKDSLFQGIGGGFMHWLGGMGVDRSKSNNFVHNCAQLFKNGEIQALAIAPEGTRKKTKYWKTGFYYIALEAQVPIVFGIINAKEKSICLEYGFIPTGNIDDDFKKIQALYQNAHGLIAHNFCPPVLPPKK
jgi:1-acyl-sn-glycerol-3-phosphate acyltransferase